MAKTVGPFQPLVSDRTDDRHDHLPVVAQADLTSTTADASTKAA